LDVVIVKSDNAPTTVDERRSSKKRRSKMSKKTFSQVIVPGPADPKPDFNPMIEEDEHRDRLDQSMLLKKQMYYNH
jgi:hypothetical protein